MKALSPLVVALAAVLPAQVPDLYEMTTVRDVYLQFSQANWWTLLEQNHATKTNIPVDMTVDGVTYPNVGVRFRGNTSFNWLPPAPQQGWEKKSFNIEMDWQVAGQDIYGYDSLNFNNGFHDPLFLREPLTYYVMRQHGVAPKANWIRLHLNGAYWGIYINVQQPNKDMMKEWFRSNDGNRYRCFPLSGGFQNGRCCYTWLGNNLATYLQAYEAKLGDGTDLLNMCDVLNNTATGTLQSVLTDVLNVDAFYRYAAVMNVCTQTDSYIGSGKDHFLYMDEVHGDGTTLPFDLNEGLQGSTTLRPTYNTNLTSRPAFRQTLQFSDWRRRYQAHLHSIITHTFNPTHLTPLAQQFHALISNDVINDTKKIYSTTAFQQNLNNTVSIPSPSPSPGNVSVPGLVPFIQGRYNYLAGHNYLNAARPALSNLAHTPATPNPTEQITITVDTDSLATAVNLFSRTLGKFTSQPMFDDGNHGDGAAGDGTWGVILPAQAPGALIDYFVEAVAAGNGASYEPHTAELEINCPKIQIDWPYQPSPIVINEFVAQNQTGVVDEAGQHEDWLELYNTSNQPVDVSGMWLTDNLTQLKWPIPAGTVIPAEGVLSVWCDEDGTQGPMHANFKLSSGGEEIGLFNPAGTALHDSFVFGQQTVDVATGRLYDGQPIWTTLPTPTHNALNHPVICGQRSFGGLQAQVHGVDLTLSGPLQIGSNAIYDIQNGPVGATALGAMSLFPDYFDLSPFGVDEPYLLSPVATFVAGIFNLNASGAASWTVPLPNDPGFVGVQVYAQALTVNGLAFDSSQAIEMRICP